MNNIDAILTLIYIDEASANAGLANAIVKLQSVKAEPVKIPCVSGFFDFKFIGMENPGEWYGDLDGIMITDNNGEQTIFASWFTPCVKLQEDFCIEKMLQGIELMSSADNY